MPRERQIGITWEQRDLLLRWYSTDRNRLNDRQRKHLKYNIKKVIRTELEDLTWLFNKFGGLKDCPFEIVLPSRKQRYSSFSADVAAMLDIVKQIEEWETALKELKQAVIQDPQHYIRS